MPLWVFRPVNSLPCVTIASRCGRKLQCHDMMRMQWEGPGRNPRQIPYIYLLMIMQLRPQRPSWQCRGWLEHFNATYRAISLVRERRLECRGWRGRQLALPPLSPLPGRARHNGRARIRSCTCIMGALQDMSQFRPVLLRELIYHSCTLTWRSVKKHIFRHFIETSG